MRQDPPPESADPEDRARWDAVEDVSELLHEQRFREALADLRAILEREPRNPYALFFAGVALYETGQLEPARDAYRACLTVAPRHLGARVALTHVLRATGDLRGAIKEGTEALSQAPGDGDALFAIAMAYYARGDEAAAVRYFHAFLDAGPEYETAEEVRALLVQMGQRPS